MADWTTMSAADLGRGIGAGEIDPVALTETYLDAIRAHAFAPRIYARLTEDRALAEAEAARDRARLGLRRGVLDGVPVSWKDLYDTAGVATESGSALLKGRVPARDAEVLRNATQAGLVCLGKTHMSELAFSGLGLNPVTATSPCVNDHDAAPGGSSSGAAASVAFGLAPAGIGSDTGGSVRLPACWNDLVGLKTTVGRLPLTGVVPLITSFDTVGPLCRTVEDAALLLGALEGAPAPDLRNPRPVKGLRLGALQTVVLDAMEEVPARAYRAALERLEGEGAVIVPFDFPEIEAPMDASGMLYSVEAWATWREAIEADPQAMFQPIRERFELGKTPAAADFVAAWKRLEEVRLIWAERTAGFDAVIVPTAPNLPPKVEMLMQLGETFAKANLLTLRNTRLGNLLGGAIVHLPGDTPSCGVSLMAPPMAEHRVLRLAAEVESTVRGVA